LLLYTTNWLLLLFVVVNKPYKAFSSPLSRRLEKNAQSKLPKKSFIRLDRNYLLFFFSALYFLFVSVTILSNFGIGLKNHFI